MLAMVVTPTKITQHGATDGTALLPIMAGTRSVSVAGSQGILPEIVRAIRRVQNVVGRDMKPENVGEEYVVVYVTKWGTPRRGVGHETSSHGPPNVYVTSVANQNTLMAVVRCNKIGLPDLPHRFIVVLGAGIPRVCL